MRPFPLGDEIDALREAVRMALITPTDTPIAAGAEH